MSLSPEEMFYLATGLLDLNSWTGSSKSKADNNEHSRTKCAGRQAGRQSVGLNDSRLEKRNLKVQWAAHKNLGFDRTKESVASATFESMHPSSPRKNCCSSPSSLSSHAGRCSSECLGQVSLNMSPSSSSGRPSWRTIYLTMLVIFLAFSLQTAVVSFCHWTFECLFGYLSPESSHVVRRRRLRYQQTALLPPNQFPFHVVKIGLGCVQWLPATGSG
ncbi:hypothetical protein DAPPUDRAFT_228448 [Daphnia pulex]|uniref:Uncharacterized protein n=1 Tax=Daphnia pulex TaxID=6669 RepID=E9HDK3_DAPPU|nr:hypothetical protein DAPPUDRAFT_228448 [Daphnia pulex]|eukprot:EFX70159.1 hypothetical protein DAPPUDRAFT_228448 [Daphnia pulex]